MAAASTGPAARLQQRDARELWDLNAPAARSYMRSLGRIAGAGALPARRPPRPRIRTSGLAAWAPSLPTSLRLEFRSGKVASDLRSRTACAEFGRSSTPGAAPRGAIELNDWVPDHGRTAVERLLNQRRTAASIHLCQRPRGNWHVSGIARTLAPRARRLHRVVRRLGTRAGCPPRPHLHRPTPRRDGATGHRAPA